jgi:hypothetical protein
MASTSRKVIGVSFADSKIKQDAQKMAESGIRTPPCFLQSTSRVRIARPPRLCTGSLSGEHLRLHPARAEHPIQRDRSVDLLQKQNPKPLLAPLERGRPETPDYQPAGTVLLLPVRQLHLHHPADRAAAAGVHPPVHGVLPEGPRLLLQRSEQPVLVANGDHSHLRANLPRVDFVFFYYTQRFAPARLLPRPHRLQKLGRRSATRADGEGVSLLHQHLQRPIQPKEACQDAVVLRGVDRHLDGALPGRGDLHGDQRTDSFQVDGARVSHSIQLYRALLQILVRRGSPPVSRSSWWCARSGTTSSKPPSSPTTASRRNSSPRTCNFCKPNSYKTPSNPWSGSG